MHAILIGFGSAGDVNPLVAIGRSLTARGHRVTVVANGHFARSVAKAGLGFLEFGSEELFLEGTKDPSGAHPIKSIQSLMKIVGESTRPLYDMLAERFVPGDTVAVGTSLAFGARVAQEKLGLPLVTVHMCPLAFRSTHEHAVLPGVPEAPWAPRSLRDFGWWAGDRLILDPYVEPPLNAARAELGLAPVRRPCHRWLNSTTSVMGLFPSWFGAPQPDWPAHTSLVGFIRDPVAEDPPLAPELEAFLAEGEAPIVFTPGSANRHGRELFETAVTACERLGRRALLVTQFPEQVPERLPSSMLSVRFAPFGRLLPRASALVHHGGIGTAVQAMAAGIPQLVVPVAYDQPDNASRLVRFGVARSLLPNRFRVPAAVRDLGYLLGAPEVATACARLAARFTTDTAREEACDLIEGMLQPKAQTRVALGA